MIIMISIGCFQSTSNVSARSVPSEFISRLQTSFTNENAFLISISKKPSYLKPVKLNHQPKIVLINVSTLANHNTNSPPLPYLSSSPDSIVSSLIEHRTSNDSRIEFVYEQLKFYLATNLDQNQLEIIYEISEQKDDFVDLIVKNEERLIMDNLGKLVSYLRLKVLQFLTDYRLLGQAMVRSMTERKFRKFRKKSNVNALDHMCRSRMSIDGLIRMFIINEWINKQNEKLNYFEFNDEHDANPIRSSLISQSNQDSPQFRETPAIENSEKKIMNDVLSEICSKDA